MVRANQAASCKELFDCRIRTSCIGTSTSPYRPTTLPDGTTSTEVDGISRLGNSLVENCDFPVHESKQKDSTHTGSFT